MFCPKCGSTIPEGQNFCTVCGTAAQPTPAAPVAAAPAPASYNPQPAAPAQQYAAPQYPQPQYAAPQYPVNAGYGPSFQQPAVKLATNRKLVKYFFFSLITCGIYSIIFFTNISNSINTAASRYDGKKTMNYCLVTFIFSWLTLGILPFVWMITTSSRIGNELKRRGINYYFGAGSFWLWNILGSLFIAGPFIYIHKLSTAMNLICRDYNLKG